MTPSQKDEDMKALKVKALEDIFRAAPAREDLRERVKRAAEEYALTIWSKELATYDEKQDCANAFLAGDAHGFARAVKMLREFKDERNSLRIPALHMADWLENIQSTKG